MEITTQIMLNNLFCHLRSVTERRDQLARVRKKLLIGSEASMSLLWRTIGPSGHMTIRKRN